jgi:hypothetical protein
VRADQLAEVVARAERIPLPTTNEWRRADEQSRGEGVLSLMTSRVVENVVERQLSDPELSSLVTHGARTTSLTAAQTRLAEAPASPSAGW